MKYATRLIFGFVFFSLLQACSDDSVFSNYYEGDEVAFNVVEYNHSVDIPSHMAVIKTPEQLTTFWNYYTGILTDAGEMSIPGEPTIDFDTRTAVALFVTDNSACEHTSVNRILDDGDILSIRLRHTDSGSITGCALVLDPSLLLVTLSKTIGYYSRFYELYYDCVYC